MQVVNAFLACVSGKACYGMKNLPFFSNSINVNKIRNKHPLCTRCAFLVACRQVSSSSSTLSCNKGKSVLEGTNFGYIYREQLTSSSYNSCGATHKTHMRPLSSFSPTVHFYRKGTYLNFGDKYHIVKGQAFRQYFPLEYFLKS